MMTQISFFTPLTFQNQPTTITEDIIELIDDYFYLAGKKAYVISDSLVSQSRGAFLREDSQSFIITAFKIASWMTIALPVLALCFKYLLRSTFDVCLANAQEIVEEGIIADDDLLEKLCQVLPLVKAKKAHPDVIDVLDLDVVSFRIKSYPSLSFKVALSDSHRNSLVNLYEDRNSIMKTLLSYNLDLLKIPHCKLLQTDFGDVLVEEHFFVNNEEKQQEQNYQFLRGISEPLKQLACLFIKSPFNDFSLASLPLLDDDTAFEGKRRVLIKNLKYNCSLGEGLPNLASRVLKIEQIELLYKEAKYHLATCLEEIKLVFLQRKREIDHEHALYEFYQAKGITLQPRKLISMDILEDQDIDDQEIKIYHANISSHEGTRFTFKSSKNKITMKQAFSETIRRINDLLLKAPFKDSLKTRRLVYLDKVGVSWLDYKHPLAILKDDWLEKILNKLVEKRNIYKIDHQNEEGFFVQA